MIWLIGWNLSFNQCDHLEILWRRKRKKTPSHLITVWQENKKKRPLRSKNKRPTRSMYRHGTIRNELLRVFNQKCVLDIRFILVESSNNFAQTSILIKLDLVRTMKRQNCGAVRACDPGPMWYSTEETKKKKFEMTSHTQTKTRQLLSSVLSLFYDLLFDFKSAVRHLNSYRGFKFGNNDSIRAVATHTRSTKMIFAYFASPFKRWQCNWVRLYCRSASV